jgi:hypothetical protein
MGSLPDVRSRTQPIVRPRSRGSLPRLPHFRRRSYSHGPAAPSPVPCSRFKPPRETPDPPWPRLFLKIPLHLQLCNFALEALELLGLDLPGKACRGSSRTSSPTRRIVDE